MRSRLSCLWGRLPGHGGGELTLQGEGHLSWNMASWEEWRSEHRGRVRLVSATGSDPSVRPSVDISDPQSSLKGKTHSRALVDLGPIISC